MKSAREHLAEARNALAEIHEIEERIRSAPDSVMADWLLDGTVAGWGTRQAWLAQLATAHATMALAVREMEGA